MYFKDYCRGKHFTRVHLRYFWAQCKNVWGPHRRVALKWKLRQTDVRIYRHNAFDTKSEIQPDFWHLFPWKRRPHEAAYIAIASNRPWLQHVCWMKSLKYLLIDYMSVDMGLSGRVESLSLVLHNHNYFSFTVHVKYKTAVIAVESKCELGVIPSTCLCQTTCNFKLS